MSLLKFKTLQDISEYLEEIKGKFYFRGYRDYKKYQIPSLGRRSGFEENEISIIQDFASSPDMVAKKQKPYISFWSMVSIMACQQELIDWTKDPLVALFFAIGKQEDIEENKNIKIAFISREDQRIKDSWNIIDVTLGDLDGYSLEDMDNLTLGELESVDPIESKVTNPLFEKKYLEFLQTSENVLLIKDETSLVNLRRDVQSGLFTFHKKVNEPILQAMSRDEIEISLSREEIKELSWFLSSRGYTKEKLLPENDDIKKVVDSIKKKYEGYESQKSNSK